MAYTYTPDRWRDKYFETAKPKKPTGSTPKPKAAQKTAKRSAATAKEAKPEVDYNAIINAYAASRDAKKQLENEQFTRNMAEVDKAYKQAQQRHKDELSASVNMQKGRSNESLRKLYIDKELARRDTPLQMSASGISGGLTRAGLNDIDKSYGAERDNIHGALQSTLGNLQHSANAAQQSETQAYTKQVATLENAYKKAIQDMETEYERLIAKLKL